FRKAMGPEWTTAALAHSLPNHWVEVTGWLMFDFEHMDNAVNSRSPLAKPGEIVWRATCWELHPVTRFKVLDGPPADAPPPPVTALDALQKAHAQHLKLNPQAAKQISERNERYRAHFKGDEDVPDRPGAK